MPLTDRPEFRAWLANRNNDLIGKRHGNAITCTACGNALDPKLDSQECLVCLAERFGTETAEAWLAEAIAGFIAAAADPAALAQILAELIAHARDIAAIRAPTTA